jgi:hypothetical protein
MSPYNGKQALARVSAETGERVRASASSVEDTNRHVEASRTAVDRSLETLANTVRRSSTAA